MLAPSKPHQTAVEVGIGTFESLNPASGEVVATCSLDGAEQVAAAVERARVSARWWRAQGFAGRREHLLTARTMLARRLDEIADLVHRENGKPRVDAVLEVVLAIEHLDWAARHARRVLGRHQVYPGLMMLNQRAAVEYLPLGVIGVIGPWNYPVYTPMGSLVYALAAGNAVVFKPSEYTPAVGRWLADLFAQAIPQHRLIHVVTGRGETGQALCRAGVDKLAFTGSAPTGRRVMAACAETLTPVLMELGGKDAMIVDDGADLDAAARGAVWGALQNAGQACVSVERVYATEAVYEPLVARVTRLAGAVRAGDDEGADIGPITMPGQVEVIQRHLADAFARGARAVVGGPDAVHPPYVDPVVLVDVPEDALIMREETFGPVLPIVRVANADEAVRRANASRYGLAAAVYGGRGARAVASRLRCGMVSVNSVTSFAAIPALPFGGVGDSGFGRVHGADGLREFTRARAIAEQRFRLPVDLLTFKRPERVVGLLKKTVRLRHGR